MKTNQSNVPFNDIRALFDHFPAIDEAAVEKVKTRDSSLTKPPGSLGRLEEIAIWLAGWQASYPPKVERPMAVVFAGNHGVVDFCNRNRSLGTKSLRCTIPNVRAGRSGL